MFKLLISIITILCISFTYTNASENSQINEYSQNENLQIDNDWQNMKKNLNTDPFLKFKTNTEKISFAELKRMGKNYLQL